MYLPHASISGRCTTKHLSLCVSPLEHAVAVYVLVAAHPQQRAVGKADASTLAQQAFLDEHHKEYGEGLSSSTKRLSGTTSWN